MPWNIYRWKNLSAKSVQLFPSQMFNFLFIYVHLVNVIYQ